MLSQMESEQRLLLKRLSHDGWLELDADGPPSSLEPLLETGLIRTVTRGGPVLIVLSGRGVQASERPYLI